MDNIEKNLINKPEGSSEEIESSVPESFEVIEISEEQLQEHADIVKTDIDRQTSELTQRAEATIESSTKDMSPEIIKEAREETGLGAQLEEIQSEANQIAQEAESKIENIKSDTANLPAERYNWYGTPDTAGRYDIYGKELGEDEKTITEEEGEEEITKTENKDEEAEKDEQESADDSTENKEKLSQEELKGLEKGFDDLTDSIQRLCVEIRERKSEGLDTLIDQGNYSRLRGLSTEVESMFGKNNISMEELKQFIQGTTSAIGEIGKAGKERGGAKDDLDSLKKVSTFLNRIEDECVGMLNKLRGVEKEEAKVLIESFKKLKNKTGDAADYISRKLIAMKRYLG